MTRPKTGPACLIKVPHITTATTRDNGTRICFPSVNSGCADFGETMLIEPWVDETVGLTPASNLNPRSNET